MNDISAELNFKLFPNAPNIEIIRNTSGYAVQSDGALPHPSLNLLREDLEEEDKSQILNLMIIVR